MAARVEARDVQHEIAQRGRHGRELVGHVHRRAARIDRPKVQRHESVDLRRRAQGFEKDAIGEAGDLHARALEPAGGELVDLGRLAEAFAELLGGQPEMEVGRARILLALQECIESGRVAQAQRDAQMHRGFCRDSWPGDWPGDGRRDSGDGRWPSWPGDWPGDGRWPSWPGDWPGDGRWPSWPGDGRARRAGD